MVRNAFKEGMGDADRTPLRDVIQPEPEKEQEPQSQPTEEPQAQPAHKRAAANGDKPGRPALRRLGSDITEDNWRAWKLMSMDTGIQQRVLLNVAFEQCFQNGGLDMTLVQKYEEILNG